MKFHVVRHHSLRSEHSVTQGTPELAVHAGAHVLDENQSKRILLERFFYIEVTPDAQLGQYGWNVLRINVISERWLRRGEGEIQLAEFAL